MILETTRLYLREMRQSDYDSLCRMLQDEEVMYAHEYAFSDEKLMNGWTGRLTDTVCSALGCDMERKQRNDRAVRAD